MIYDIILIDINKQNQEYLSSCGCSIQYGFGQIKQSVSDQDYSQVIYMLKNPFIRFDLQSQKGDLFPKYAGKYLVQSPSHQRSKDPSSYTSQNNSLITKSHKYLKAEADYVQQIKQLKKKLQKQIEKYNNEKRHNQFIARMNCIKVEEICVNVKRGQDEANEGNPGQKYEKQENKKHHNRLHSLFRHKTEHKKKARTQPLQENQLTLSLKSYRRNTEIDQDQIERRESSLLGSKSEQHTRQMQKLPVINHSSVRYSLPSVSKMSIKAQHIGFDSYKRHVLPQEEYPQYLKYNSGSMASCIKKSQSKKAYGIKLHKKPSHQLELLKGWDQQNQRYTLINEDGML